LGRKGLSDRSGTTRQNRFAIFFWLGPTAYAATKSPWARKGLSGNPFGAAKRLERKARFFAKQKMRHESSKKVNVFARAASCVDIVKIQNYNEFFNRFLGRGNCFMETRFYENGVVEIIDANVILKEADDVFSLFFINNCSAIILKRENVISDFFNLSTGLAGEILQKFSNYNKRMAIIGDFENVKSKALHDFIYESNKTKQILFVKTAEEALKIFGK
jgi:hypothetical protein